MSALDLFRTALEALDRNRMRTLLSVLGIVIGIASVVSMLAIGEGSKESIRSQIAGMGTNMVTIMPNRNARSGAKLDRSAQEVLEEADVEILRERATLLRWVSPYLQSSGQWINGANNWPAQIQGVSPDYLSIRGLSVASGRNFTEGETASRSKVCLLGKTVADNLFPDGTDPVGKWVRFNKRPMLVVGVLAPKGTNGFGQDQDDIVLAPWTTVQRRILSTTSIRNIQASVADENRVDEAIEEATGLLMERRRGKTASDEEPFVIRSQKEMLDMMGSTAQTLSFVLTAVAALSLLVGGIGIMNIMLVSVTERIREIGLRMAIGARQRDILAQFLLESVLVSLIGGLAGILVGLGASAIVSFGLKWPVSVTPASVVLSFCVCAGTGVVFGWLPARKASRLDPIAALRRE